jgi:lysophospholipase L1-like esterase
MGFNPAMRIIPLPRFLLSAFAAATLGLISVQAVESSTEPAERTGGPAERFKMLNERVKEANGVCDVLFVGDSITQGWEGAGKTVWEHYYGGRKALNIGIGGDRTQHLLWRFEHGNLDGLKPKVTVLMIGTNNSGEERNSTGDIVAGVTKVVEALRSKLPGTKILLVGIFPRGQTFNYQRGQVAQANQAISKLADGDHVRWLDFSAEYLSAEGLISKSIMPDYLHPASKGYILWSEAMEDTLSKLLGDQRVPAMTEVDLTGQWNWTTAGPDGNPVVGLMVLEQRGGKITGKFARSENTWLQFNDGVLTGSDFKWTVRRDRPNGGTMVYQMSGTLSDGKISGSTSTTLDGQEMKSPWSAERKK